MFLFDFEPRIFHLHLGMVSLSKRLTQKETFTKTPLSIAITLLFSLEHVRIFYGPPPTLYAEGLSDLSRTCIGGESEVVRS